MSTSYCTLCAKCISSSNGSTRTRSRNITEYFSTMGIDSNSSSTPAPSCSVWGSLFSVLGVVSPFLNSSLFSLCASCSTGLKELVGLKSQLTRLEEYAKKSAALRSLVANSVACQQCFNPPAIQLRAEVLGQGGDGDGGYSCQSETSIYQTEESQLKNISSSRLSRLNQQAPQPNIDLNKPQTAVQVDSLLCTPPLLDAQESLSQLNNVDQDFEPCNTPPDGEDANLFSEDTATPCFQEDEDMVPPPKRRKKMGKRGEPGKMSEEQRLSMLAKRRMTIVEKFSPIVTTEDGKKFYDGYEIRTLPTGTLQCVTCGWKEGNDGTELYRRARSMKVHIKGIHQKAFKCSACDITFTSHYGLRKHDCGNGKRKPGFECGGCHKMFLFRYALSKHIKAFNCGKASCPSSPCPICGRPTNVNYISKHLRTHMNEKEKAEDTEARPIRTTRVVNKNPCPTCGKMVSKSHFKHHLNLHNEAKEQKLVHVCPERICKGKKFTRRSNLMAHTRRRHGIFEKRNAFHCPICNAEQHFLSDLTHHIKLHEKRGQTAEMYTMVCSVDGCRQKSVSLNRLQIHRAWKHPGMKKKPVFHTDNKETVGDGKPQQSATHGSMIQRRNGHNQEDSIKCSICERIIPSSQMDLHRWTHRGVDDILSALNSGEKLPIVYLANTVNPVHAIPSSLNWADISIKCDHCGDGEHEPEDFTNPAQLYKHILTHHPELYVDKNKSAEVSEERKMEAEVNLNK